MIDTIRRAARFYFDLLATGTLDLTESLQRRQSVTCEEQADGQFQVKNLRFSLDHSRLHSTHAAWLAHLLQGADVTILIRPERVLFRRVEFPAKAAPFLDKMLLAQIDRLTPWTAEHCGFGWSGAVISGDTLSATLAASPRQALEDLARCIQNLGAHATHIAVCAPGGSQIGLLHLNAQRRASQRLRAYFAAALAAITVLALASSLYAGWQGAELDQSLQSVQNMIADLRSGMTRQPTNPAAHALAALKRRKTDQSAAVLRLEELTRRLPDNSYLTSLQLEGDTLRMSGISTDAPALVTNLEQSPLFKNAHFSAPTTQSPEDPRDHFQLELNIRDTAGTAP